MFAPGQRRKADAEEVARLDTEYKAAVARNDATGMARILAVDFVLISSTGKVYDRNDLLREAESGTIIYERQDD